MSCEEIESQILDYQEDQLPFAQRDKVAAHLAACVHCRTFFQQLRQLDSALTAEIKAPKLSAAFDQRLRERIQIESSVLSEAQREERKRQLQSEFESGLAQIRRSSFAAHTLLSYLTQPILGIVAGWIVWQLAFLAVTHLKLDIFYSTLLPWLFASVAFLLANLNKAFPPPWKSSLRW